MADNNPTANRPGPEGTAGNNAGDYSFRCGDVMNGCNWSTSANSESELRRNMEQHGREHHGMTDFGEDTWNKVKGFIRRKAA